MLHRFFPAVSRVVRPLLINSDMYAGLSQLVWADAIFIKDLSRLEVLSDAQLLKTARILHDCYQSVDVALYLLTEYDRRTQGHLGDAYLAGLQGAAPGRREMTTTEAALRQLPHNFSGPSRSIGKGNWPWRKPCTSKSWRYIPECGRVASAGRDCRPDAKSWQSAGVARPSHRVEAECCRGS